MYLLYTFIKSLPLPRFTNPFLLKSRIIIRIGSLLIALGLLTSQVGLNFFHSHKSTATEMQDVAAIQIDDTTAPCSVCALGVLPTLCVQSSSLFSSTTFSTDFISTNPASVLLLASSAALGRAPPVL